MRFLRSNTAVIVTVGPFYDKTDGVTIETALTITNERITLTADTDAGSAPTNILDNITGATSATANDLNYITGNDAGLMQLELAAADVNRVGRMMLSITDAANHVPVFHEFTVLPQAIYDWLIAGTIVPLPANVTQWLGSAAAAPTVAGVPEVDVTHWIGTAAATPSVAGVPEVDLTHVAGATTNVSALATNVAAILADTGTDGVVVNAASLAADAGTEIGTAVWATAARTLTAATNITSTGGTTVPQTGDSFARLGAAGAGLTAIADQVWDEVLSGHLTATTTGAALNGASAPTAAAVADAVWDEAAAGHTTAGTFGKSIDDVQIVLDIVAADTATNIPALIPTAAVVADAVWDEVLSGHLTATTTGNALNAAGAAGDPWTTAIPGAYGAGTAGKILGDNINATISSRASQASLDTVDNFLDTEMAAVLAAVDTEVAAIKAKTDNLPTDPADHSLVIVATDAIYARLGAPAGASVSADIAAIEAQTDDIGVAGAGLTAIPWNAAWDAEVQSEAADALTAYDPPTNAEMEARTLVSAGYASPTNITAGTITTVTNLTNAPALSAADVDAVLDEAIGDGTLTLRQAMRVLVAGMAGKLSGAASTTITIRNAADSANVIVATVDADGNRSAVTVTP